MAQYIELGLDTFGDIQAGLNGELTSHAQVIRNVVDESVLADEVGVYCIGLGEHHRADFAISSPEVLLGAIASRTRRIHLASSVTVLSSDDPIRVFQRFSTVNALSSGRAEVILGRGSFTESFPLFGYDLSNYETLFDDKLDLFASLFFEKRAGHLARANAPSPDRSAHISTDRKRHAQNLDWCWWQSGIRGSCSALRSAANARHNWRRSQSLSSLCRPLSPRLCPVRQTGA